MPVVFEPEAEAVPLALAPLALAPLVGAGVPLAVFDAGEAVLVGCALPPVLAAEPFALR